MTDREQSGIVTVKDSAAALGAASASATAALAIPSTSAPAVLALAAVLVALFPTALAAVTEAGARRLKARADLFYQSLIDKWAQEESITREEIAGRLEAAKDDDAVADAIWRAVRGLMDAPNDAAAVPLGVLAAEYAKDKRPADAFFRGCVRLLQELSKAEHAELRQLLEWVVRTTSREEVELVARNGAVDAALDEFAHDVGVDGIPEKRAYTQVVSDPDRLFGLLTTNGLAVSYPGMRFDQGLPEITLRRPIALRLLAVLTS